MKAKVIELRPDGWQRFRLAVQAAAKAGPKPSGKTSSRAHHNGGIQRVREELKLGPATAEEMAASLEISKDAACSYLCTLEAAGVAVVDRILTGRDQERKGPPCKVWRLA